jgi:hypothetical protein
MPPKASQLIASRRVLLLCSLGLLITLSISVAVVGRFFPSLLDRRFWLFGFLLSLPNVFLWCVVAPPLLSRYRRR